MAIAGFTTGLITFSYGVLPDAYFPRGGNCLSRISPSGQLLHGSKPGRAWTS